MIFYSIVIVTRVYVLLEICDITSPIFSQTLPPVNYMLQVFYNYLDMRDFDTSSNIQNTCIRNLSAFLLETINFDAEYKLILNEI